MSYTQGTWDTATQIREHKLASSVINLHGTEDCVFDDASLKELEDFTMNRSTKKRDEFRKERGYLNGFDATKRGNKVAEHGSLTDFIIARYGTNDEALDETDWQLLEEWFKKGMPVGESVVR